MTWTELFFRIFSRRWWAFALLALAIGARLAAPNNSPAASQFRIWDAALMALIVWCGIILTWRASDERHTRRRVAQDRADWTATSRRLAARMLAFIVPGRDDDGPETDELKAALARRHEAVFAAATALLEHREPSAEPGVAAHTNPVERGDLTGKALLDRLVALQRDALVEAERRGWLSAGRFATVEADLATLASLPEPARTWTSGFTRLSTVMVTLVALSLPWAAPPRLAGFAIGALIAAALIAFDALSE
jgi:hypothetical protein